MSEYTMEDWLKMERELTRERGLWGPPVGSELDKWMLDMTEGFTHHSCFLFVVVTFLKSSFAMFLSDYFTLS